MADYKQPLCDLVKKYQSKKKQTLFQRDKERKNSEIQKEMIRQLKIGETEGRHKKGAQINTVPAVWRN